MDQFFQLYNWEGCLGLLSHVVQYGSLRSHVIICIRFSSTNLLSKELGPVFTNNQEDHSIALLEFCACFDTAMKTKGLMLFQQSVSCTEAQCQNYSLGFA